MATHDSASAADGGSCRYWACITCSPRDVPHARRLRRCLEAYGVPTDLRGTTTPRGDAAPPRFRPVAVRHGGGSTKPAANDPLATSRWLVVVCSPAAADDVGVAADIAAFQRTRGAAAVIAFIVSGDPHASGDSECFPAVFRAAEPLAADARRTGDGWHVAVLKILAGMLGVRLDALRRREQQRRQRWALRAAVLSFVILLATGGVTAWAIVARARAIAARDRAEHQFTGFLSVMQEQLLPLQQQGIMDRLASAIERYEASAAREPASFEELKNRATAHTTLGDTTALNGSLEDALAEYDRAAQVVNEGLATWPEGRAVAHQMLCRIQRRIAEIEDHRGDPGAARAALNLALAANEAATLAQPDDQENRVDYGLCGETLAELENDAGRPQQAIVLLTDAVERLGRSDRVRHMSDAAAEALARCLHQLGRAHILAGDRVAARPALVEAREVCQRLLSGDAKPTRLLRLYSAVTRLTGDLEAMLGEIEAAAAQFNEAFEIDLGLSQNDPENWDKFQQAVTAGLSLARFNATHRRPEQAMETHEAWRRVFAINQAAYRKRPPEATSTVWQMTTADGLHGMGETELRLLGSCEKAITAFQESIRIKEELLARDAGSTVLMESLCDSLGSLAIAQAENGDVGPAIACLDDVIERASKLLESHDSSVDPIAWLVARSDALAARGMLLLSAGDVDAATKSLEAARLEREQLEAAGTPTALPLVLVRLAEAAVAAGKPEQAGEHISRAQMLIAQRSPDARLRASGMAAIPAAAVSSSEGRFAEAAAAAAAGFEAVSLTPAAATIRDTVTLRARLRSAQGLALALAGNAAEGVTLCREAVDMVANIMGTNTLTPSEEAMTADALKNLARCRHLADRRMGREDCQRAVAILEPLVRVHPGRFDWALRLGEARLLLGELLGEDDHANAFAVCDENVDALTQLADSQPSRADARQLLIRANLQAAGFHDRAGHKDAAAAHRDDARASLESLRRAGGNPDFDLERLFQ